MERGERPVTAELRQPLKLVVPSRKSTLRPRQEVTDERFRGQVAAWDYPGFASLPPTRFKLAPSALLLVVLAQPNVDSRVMEAMPWLLKLCAGQLDLPWLVRQAKVHDQQNRLGFLLEVSGVQIPQFLTAIGDLKRARLLEESTLCWEAMPQAMREWVRTNRTPLAEYWNVLTTLKTEDG